MMKDQIFIRKKILRIIEATAICVAGKPQKQKNEEPEPEGEAFLE